MVDRGGRTQTNSETRSCSAWSACSTPASFRPFKITAILPTRPAKHGKRRAKADTAGRAVAFALGRHVRGSPLCARHSLKSSAGPRLTKASAHQHDVSLSASSNASPYLIDSAANTDTSTSSSNSRPKTPRAASSSDTATRSSSATQSVRSTKGGRRVKAITTRCHSIDGSSWRSP